MSQLPDASQNSSPDVQQTYRKLLEKRGRIDGMYRTMLNNPALTEKVGAVGSYLRYESTFPPDLRELIILFCARTLGAAYEWVKHEPPAMEAGLPRDLIEAVRHKQPVPESYPLYRQALDAAECALQHRSIPESLQQSLVEQVGIDGIVELVTLCGFYSMIAGIIFAFDVPLPPDSKEPW
jgi:4-carboxymuconolactone decarboxylase